VFLVKPLLMRAPVHKCVDFVEARGWSPHRRHQTSLFLLTLVGLAGTAGIKPNMVTYTTMMSVSSKAGLWQNAISIFQEMEAAGMRPDVMAHNSVISACARGAAWEKAWSVFIGGLPLECVEQCVVGEKRVFRQAHSRAWKFHEQNSVDNQGDQSDWPHSGTNWAFRRRPRVLRPGAGCTAEMKCMGL
jgi:pentatricopeptide repeat protein